MLHLGVLQKCKHQAIFVIIHCTIGRACLVLVILLFLQLYHFSYHFFKERLSFPFYSFVFIFFDWLSPTLPFKFEQDAAIDRRTDVNEIANLPQGLMKRTNFISLSSIPSGKVRITFCFLVTYDAGSPCDRKK